jgi:glycosyltransferase involved in cell wall biosynthesis
MYDSNPNKERVCSVNSAFPHGKPKNEFNKKWRKDYKISVVIPTRNRVSLLLKCLDSFIQKSNADVPFEFVLVVDFDDVQTIAAINNLVNDKLYTNIICVTTFRSSFMQRDYNNLGVDVASGDLIFVLNDDVEMVTQDWNSLIYQKYLSIKTEDDIHLLAVADNSHPVNIQNGVDGGNGSAFPVITKTFTKLFDGAFYPDIYMWGADFFLNDVFKSIERKHMCHEVSVFHNACHGHAKSRETDDKSEAEVVNFLKNEVLK